MENQYLVSARKYRPDAFNTVVGQSVITKTLKNAIKTSKLAHAYLFCGPRGVGKTTCARIFAKTINCTNLSDTIEACNNCDSCKTFNDSRSFNIHELDAASNNHVDDIRNLIDQVRIPPQIGRYSVYIIDEVHMLSQTAFNAFLKTLEEPPSHAVFILATTEKHKIIPTILSRCQIYDFHRIQINDMIKQLEEISESEVVSADKAALHIIAQKADGSMRDALSIYDQVVSFSGNEITYDRVIEHLNVLDHDYYFKLTNHFLGGEYREALLVFDDILKNGFDTGHFLSGLSMHFRNLLVSHDDATISLFDMSDEMVNRYQDESALCPIEFLLKGLTIMSEGEIKLRQSREPRLTAEIILLNLSSITGKISSQSSSDRAESAPKTVSTAPQGPAEEKSQAANGPPSTTVDEVPKIQESTPTSEMDATSIQAPKVTKKNPVTGTRINEFISKNGTDNVDSTTDAGTNNKADGKDPLTENETGEMEKINPDSIKKIWLEFAEMQKDQTRLYHMLTTQLPELKEDRKIGIGFLNPLQEKAFKSIYHEMLHYFKKRTGEELNIDVNVEGIEKTQNALYTQEEKYKHMQQKNPNLENLRQSLNLDFE